MLSEDLKNLLETVAYALEDGAVYEDRVLATDMIKRYMAEYNLYRCSLCGKFTSHTDICPACMDYMMQDDDDV